MDIKAYLESKSDIWLESEMEQAHATVFDGNVPEEKRTNALAAFALISDEITRRKHLSS